MNTGGSDRSIPTSTSQVGAISRDSGPTSSEIPRHQLNIFENVVRRVKRVRTTR